MSKLSLLAVASSLAGLSSCIPPGTAATAFPPEPALFRRTWFPLRHADRRPRSSRILLRALHPAAAGLTATGGYPTATRTTNPDQVRQPLRAVQRHRRGRLQAEANSRATRSNQKIFRVPWAESAQSIYFPQRILRRRMPPAVSWFPRSVGWLPSGMKSAPPRLPETSRSQKSPCRDDPPAQPAWSDAAA